MRLPHLKTSTVRLFQGSDLIALCGKEVKDVRFDFTAAGGDISGKYMPSGDFCPNCEMKYQGEKDAAYVYGIYPAKWIRNREAGNE